MKFTFKNDYPDDEAASGRKKEMNAVKLTRREKEILELVAEGLTAQEIAKKLFVSLDTVESHRRNIIQKLAGRNAVDAVVKAMRLGLIK